jgi:hypothetical protein
MPKTLLIALVSGLNFCHISATSFDRSYVVTLDIAVNGDYYFVSIREPCQFADFDLAACTFLKTKGQMNFFKIERGCINILNPEFFPTTKMEAEHARSTK